MMISCVPSVPLDEQTAALPNEHITTDYTSCVAVFSVECDIIEQ